MGSIYEKIRFVKTHSSYSLMKTNIKIQNLLKIREAAEMLSVNPETLRRWDRSGKLKAIIISKRGDRRYREEDIKELIKHK